MTTLLDPRTTLAYLAYLGYPHSSQTSDQLLPSTSALSITRPRKQDRKKGTVSRNVHLAYVLGAAGSGKTAILRAFVGKSLKERFEPTMQVKTVVNSVEHGGSEKYLVLQEFGSNYESEVLRSPKKLALADVLVFVYDSSDTNSFSYLSNLRVRAGTTRSVFAFSADDLVLALSQQQYNLSDIPSLFVATKSDLDLAQQRHEVQPDAYCRRLSLRVPVAVSMKSGQFADLFNTITGIATHPLSAVPGGGKKDSNWVGTMVYLAGGLGAVVGVGFLVWRGMGRAGLGWVRN